MIDNFINVIKEKDPELKFDRYYFLASTISILAIYSMMYFFKFYNFLILFLFSFIVSIMVVLIYMCKIVSKEYNVFKLDPKQVLIIYVEIMRRDRLDNIKNFLVENKLNNKAKVKFLLEYSKSKRSAKVGRDLIGYMLSIILSFVGSKLNNDTILEFWTIILIFFSSIYFFKVIKTFVNAILKKADYYDILYDTLSEIYLQF